MVRFENLKELITRNIYNYIDIFKNEISSQDDDYLNNVFGMKVKRKKLRLEYNISRKKFY